MNQILLKSTFYAGSPSLVLREGAGGWVNKSTHQFGILFFYQFRKKMTFSNERHFFLPIPEPLP